MKKTIIGTALLISATLADIGIVISAAILATGLTEWSGSKLWTAVMENQLYFPFVLTKILFIVALVILFREYYDKKQTNTIE